MENLNKIVYSKSKTGKILEWSANLNIVPNKDGYLEITITSGQQDGKKISKIKTVKSGMNIGKSNETSLLEQAELELKRLYQTQYDKGYTDTIETIKDDKSVNDIPKVMLADKYPEKEHKLPSDINHIKIQKKYDGNRCLITKLEDSSIRFSSRSGKLLVSIPHIEEELKNKLSVGDIMDGELIIPNQPLQYITGVVSGSKDSDFEKKKDLIYYWYDYIPKDGKDLAYEERYINNSLKDSFNNTSIIYVGVDEYNPNTVEEYFNKYINEGFEGLMLRDITSPYYFGKRSTSLLKYKKMESDEFKILDILPSDQDEAPRFICDLRNGNTVTVRLKGNKEQNLEYLDNKANYINKWLTINYQTWTDTGSLQFPVGIEIRDGDIIDNKFVPSI